MSLLEIAVEAARAGGEVLVPRFGRELALAAKSTPTDLVSEADLASERAIRAVLAARRPDDGVLGEEGTGDLAGTTGLRWVVDPLDGTIDYLYGIPQWCVSVAVEDDEGGVAGVVWDPLREELWTAQRGSGAFLNGMALAPPASVAPLERALIATGFGYDSAVREAQGALVARLLPAVRDIRRAGSAALDLVWTAAGRHDAYYEFGVKPWDWAAGALVCREAGRAVVQLPAGDVLPSGLAVGPQPLLGALLGYVAP
ncbi:MAG: inositol monophosphatase [Solirubrobacterales bacterium]|jgi:myo-inositol-1(or 4)-monophosphatase|nr:inositol monophosphatase [Solirubrobacterales bacterium]